MKKISLFLILFSAMLVAEAQTIEITPMFGYTFNGSYDAYRGKLDMKDDISYGGQLSFGMRSGNVLQLSYQRNEAKLNFIPYRGVTFPAEQFNMGAEHYQVGFVKELKQGTTVPFGLVSLGTTRYFEKSGVFSDYWMFSGSIGGGVKRYFSERFGIKFQANLILPMELSGGGFFCGSYGCGSNASFYIPVVHFELAAGLIFQLPQ
jgi:hypothetical protein